MNIKNSFSDLRYDSGRRTAQPATTDQAAPATTPAQTSHDPDTFERLAPGGSLFSTDPMAAVPGRMLEVKDRGQAQAEVDKARNDLEVARDKLKAARRDLDAARDGLEDASEARREANDAFDQKFPEAGARLRQLWEAMSLGRRTLEALELRIKGLDDEIAELPEGSQERAELERERAELERKLEEVNETHAEHQGEFRELAGEDAGAATGLLQTIDDARLGEEAWRKIVEDAEAAVDEAKKAVREARDALKEARKAAQQAA